MGNHSPLFSVGKTYCTPAAFEALGALGIRPEALLRRHQAGDWSDMNPEDQDANKKALSEGSRIFSTYLVGETKTKFWVITEADRSSTTVLLPEEY